MADSQQQHRYKRMQYTDQNKGDTNYRIKTVTETELHKHYTFPLLRKLLLLSDNNKH